MGKRELLCAAWIEKSRRLLDLDLEKTKVARTFSSPSCRAISLLHRMVVRAVEVCQPCVVQMPLRRGEDQHSGLHMPAQPPATPCLRAAGSRETTATCLRGRWRMGSCEQAEAQERVKARAVKINGVVTSLARILMTRVI